MLTCQLSIFGGKFRLHPFFTGLLTFCCSVMSVHVHSQHKALTKYAIYKCIFPACGLPLDSLNSEFRKQVFFTVMLSNLSVFPPWIMLLVLCLKIGGKFMAPRSFPSAAPPLPQQMGLKRWENQEYGRILDPLTALSCVCVCMGVQLSLTRSDPMDCSPPGFCVRGTFPGKSTGGGCHFLPQRIFPTQGLNPCFPRLLCLLH